MHLIVYFLISLSKIRGLNRFENLLSRFEGARRYEIYSSEQHKTTVEENSDLVDKIESLNKLLSETQEENSILKQQIRRQSSETQKNGGIRFTSDLLCSDGKVPGTCPLGGCLQYETVLRGSDTLKNFQNHLNNTHRVSYFLFLFNPCIIIIID